MPPALVLVAHGSPDPDWGRALERVLEGVRTLAPQRTSVLAYLEATDPRVDVTVDALVQAGHREIVLVAAFLSARGRHVQHDLPDLATALAQRHPHVTVRLVPGALGEDDEVVWAMARATLRQASTE